MPGSHALQEDAHWLGSPCNKKNEKNTEETKKSHSSLIFNFAQVNSCCLEVSSVDPWFTCSGGSMSPSPCSIFATSLACQAVMRYSNNCGGGNYRAGGRDHFGIMLVPQRHSLFFSRIACQNLWKFQGAILRLIAFSVQNTLQSAFFGCDVQIFEKRDITKDG